MADWVTATIIRDKTHASKLG
jgi:hypothetical protein